MFYPVLCLSVSVIVWCSFLKLHYATLQLTYYYCYTSLNLSAVNFSSAVPRLPDVEQLAKNPDDEMEGVPEPPPYNEAVSRLDAGISRQVETTFGADVITGPVRDEPPPDYREIGERKR